MLELKNIQKKYADKSVLKDVSLKINPGEFVVLLGPSGCGKSTLLHIIAGLTSEHQGQVLLNRQDISSCPPQSRPMRMVFQNYALYPHMNVFENMAFGAKLKKWPKSLIQEKIEQVSLDLQIQDLLLKKPHQLSGGQMQRVAIGRALVQDPEIYLFDEPLSNLDAKLKLELRKLIKNLHAQTKKTFIYVTHDQEEAFFLADRIFIFNNGGILQEGRPRDIYERPKNWFVFDFIGRPGPSLKAFMAPLAQDRSLLHIEGKSGEKKFELSLNGLKEKHSAYFSFRPENLFCLKNMDLNRNDYLPLDFKIEDVSFNGPQVFLELNFLGHKFNFQAPKNHLPQTIQDNLEIQKDITLALHQKDLLIFHQESQERIHLPFH